MTLPDATLEATAAKSRPEEAAADHPKAHAGWDILWSVVAGVISVLVAIVALRISPSDLDKRWFSGNPDMLLGYTLFKNSTQAFAFATNPDLGFPHGLNAFFSEQVDPSAAIGMSVLALVIHNGFLLLNLSFLITFFTAGIGGYFFFRALKINPLISGVFATIFSLAPYHFYRVSYGHVFLANYWAIPLVGILALVAAGDATDPFRRWGDAAATPRARLVRRLVPPTVLGLLVASTGSYYFVFGVIVVGGVWAVTVVLTLLRKEKLRSLLVSTFAIVPLGIFVVVELALLAGNYGQRYHVYFIGRLIGESELYAGRLVTFLAPWAGSRLPLLDRVLPKYQASSLLVQINEPPGAPFLASIGIVLLAVALVIHALAGRRGVGVGWFGRIIDDPRTRVLAPTMFWTFMFFTISGLGIVVALVIGPQIRAWARISIVLILIGLAFVAVLVQAATTRYGIRKILIGLVVVVALVDQVVGASKYYVVAPEHDQSIAAFAAAADDALPNGCGVVQMPVKGFPESGPIGNMQDYDEALPYLYTKSGDLRWSYGSVAGTYGYDVFGKVTSPAQFKTAVAKTGACALEIDTAAYPNDPQDWKNVAQAVAGKTTPDIISSNKRWLLFIVPGKN